MALIICSECGKEISDKAGSCPGCGCPVIVKIVNDSCEGEKNVVICASCGKKQNPDAEICSLCGNLIFEKKREENKNIRMRKAFGITNIIIGVILFLMVMTSEGGFPNNVRIMSVVSFMFWIGILSVFGKRNRIATICTIVLYSFSILLNLVYLFNVFAHFIFLVLHVIFLIITCISLGDNNSFKKCH